MDVFPLPRIDDTLDMLSDQRFFTTLDLASGYWQVRMADNAREKTAFATHVKFQVMPFGLCKVPATFQRLMETVLTVLLRKKRLCLGRWWNILSVSTWLTLGASC